MKEAQHSTTTKYSIRNDELPLKLHDQHHYLCQALPLEIGTGQSNIFHLDEDLSYIETQYSLSRDLSISSHLEFQEPRLIVTVSLMGKSRFYSQQGNEFIFNEGYTSITKINASMGERQYQENHSITQLRFSIGKKWLDKYFGETAFTSLFSKSNVQHISNNATTYPGKFAAKQLLASNNTRHIKTPFIHGQALLLLSAELNHLVQDSPNEATKFNDKDKKMAKLAEDILYNEFKTPPSLEELARRIGTNQFKLKKLFHHFFNNTPYGLLLEIRMNIAYQLLQNTQCHVNVAAESVGYQYTSNFSSAFIKYFGIAPKSVSKNH